MAEEKITSALEKELDLVERKCIRSLQVSKLHNMAAARYVNSFEPSVVVRTAAKTRIRRTARCRGVLSTAWDQWSRQSASFKAR